MHENIRTPLPPRNPASMASDFKDFFTLYEQGAYALMSDETSPCTGLWRCDTVIVLKLRTIVACQNRHQQTVQTLSRHLPVCFSDKHFVKSITDY